MYFFGYGNYIQLADSIGYSVGKHVSLKAGYQLASRLIVNAQTDRIGIHMTQRGATADSNFLSRRSCLTYNTGHDPLKHVFANLTCRWIA